MAAQAERKRVTKSPGERRRDLLEAAIKVFARKGVGASTVADVTEAAGVAKGTFYLYFESKEHLVGALKQYFVDEVMERANALVARIGRDDWWALVDTTMETIVDHMLERKDLIQIFAQEYASPETDEVFADCEHRLNEMFAAGIRAGIEAGAFAASDPEMTARFLHHALDGALIRAILYEDPVDRDRLVAGARELFRKTLAP